MTNPALSPVDSPQNKEQVKQIARLPLERTVISKHPASNARPLGRSLSEDNAMAASADCLPIVTVCVLSYNRCEKLQRVLESLAGELDYPSDKLEVIVVDNASGDETRSMIADNFPDVTLVEQTENIGITGWNDGFARATGKYILQLDDDCYVRGDSLRQAVRRMEQRPDVGILALNPLSPETGLLFAEAYPTGRLSFWGCCALLRREMLQQVGDFDPNYFFQAFELDLSIRARSAGWEIDFAPDIFALHMTTIQHEQTPTKFYYSRRNLLITALKTFSGRRRWRVLWRLAKATFQVGSNQTFMHKCRTVLSGLVTGWRCKSKPAPEGVQQIYEDNFIEFRPLREQEQSWNGNLFWAMRPQWYPTLRDCNDIYQLPLGTGTCSIECYENCSWRAAAINTHCLLTHPAPSPGMQAATITIPDVDVNGHKLKARLFHTHAESRQVLYHVRVRQHNGEVVHATATFPPAQHYGEIVVDLSDVSGRCDIEFSSTMLDPDDPCECAAAIWVRPMLVQGNAASEAIDESTAAVVVTHNRIDLLKQSLSALRNQQLRPRRIVVVNNASTDETQGWLENNPDIDVVNLAENGGGAGGFHHGTKVARRLGARWTWLLDDDTIVTADSLRHLKEAAAVKPHAGFLCSLVRWKDGQPCRMNIPLLQWEWLDSYSDHPHLFPAKSCSFVSCLVNSVAIDALGYPIKEFFIWYDDFEYTQRITGVFDAYAVLKSEVLHATASNAGVDWGEVNSRNFWKYKRGARNEATLTFRGPAGFWRGLALITDVMGHMRKAGRSLHRRGRVLIHLLGGALWNYRRCIERDDDATVYRRFAFAAGRLTKQRYDGEGWDAVWGNGEKFATSPPCPHTNQTSAAIEFANVPVDSSTEFDSFVALLSDKAEPVVFHLEIVDRDNSVVQAEFLGASYEDGHLRFRRQLTVPPGRYTVRLSARLREGAEHNRFSWAYWIAPRLKRAAAVPTQIAASSYTEDSNAEHAIPLELRAKTVPSRQT